MEKHLNDREFSDSVLGEAAERARQHLHDCVKCRRQLAEWESATENFRLAARRWNAAAAPERSLLLPQAPQPYPQWWLAFCCIVALILAIGFSLAYRIGTGRAEESHSMPISPVAAPPLESATAPGVPGQAGDDVMLSRVGSRLSAPNSAAMAPLDVSATSTTSDPPQTATRAK